MQDESKYNQLVQIVAARSGIHLDPSSTLMPLVDEVLKVHDGDVDAALATVEKEFRDNPGSTIKPLRDSLSWSSIEYQTIVGNDDSPLANRSVAEFPETIFHPNQPEPRFQAFKKHAEGGLGEIHLARDRDLNREVALKSIKSNRHDDEGSRLQFLLEGEITGSLEHPGVVPVYGMGTDTRGRPYYAMRLIRGDSLAAKIKQFHSLRETETAGQRELALRKLLQRFIDVCNAIEYAHSRGILHRDLKPDNVMVGPYGETLVVDWGLAKTIDQGPSDNRIPTEASLEETTKQKLSQRSSRGVVGTLPYMSPEQANGQFDELAPANDVFSLGAILHNMLTGKTIYGGDSMMEVLQQAKQCSIEPAIDVNRSVPPALSAVCQRAMAKYPDQRYPSARALADEIDAFLADQGVDAYDEPWTAVARRWMRQHPRIVSTVFSSMIVAGIALTLGLGVLSGKNRQISEQRDIATANLQSARTAVRESLLRISEDDQLKREGLGQLRARLLKAPASFYDDFLNQTPDDPALQFEQAEWRYLLGRITLQIGSEREAMEHFEKSRELTTRLLQDDPNNSTFLQKAAQAKLAISGIQYELGQFATAFDSAAQAQTTAAQTTAARITAARATANQMRVNKSVDKLNSNHDSNINQDRTEIQLGALRIMALVRLSENDFDELQIILDQMESVIDAIAADESDVKYAAQYRLLAARSQMEAKQGKVVAAEERLRKAIVLLQQYSPPASKADANLANLASLHNSLGIHCIEVGKPNAALEAFEAGHRIATDLATRHPDDIFYRRLVSDFDNNLTVPLSDTGVSGNREPIDSGLDRSMRQDAELQTKNPNGYFTRLGQARGLMNLGEAKLTKGETDAANKHFRSAMSIVTELLEFLPNIVDVELVRNRLLFNESERLAIQGDVESAMLKCHEAMRFVEQLIKRKVNVAAYPQMADGHRRLAQLAMQQNEWDVAEDEITKWRALYEAAPDSYRQAPAYHQQLAFAAQNMVDVQFGMGQPDAAFAEVETALKIRQHLVSKYPSETFYASQLGGLHAWYARQLLSIHGESMMPKAIDQMQQGCDAFGRVEPKWRETSVLPGQIEATLFLASRSIEASEPEQALIRQQFANRYAETLFERTRNLDYLIQQSQILIGQSRVLTELKRHDEADATLTQAQSLSERILIDEPNNLAAKRQRYAALVTRGNHLRMRSLYEDSLPFFEQALDVGGHEELSLVRILIANMKVRIGNYQTGVEIAKTAIMSSGIITADVYNAACVYALASAAATDDESLAIQDRESIAERFAKTAVDLLERAFDDPEYATEGNIKVLREDDELASLRERVDFKSFVDKLAIPVTKPVGD